MVPGASEHDEGEDTNILFPVVCRAMILLGRRDDNAKKRRVPHYGVLSLGGSAGRSGHGGEKTRRAAAPRDFNRVPGHSNCSRIAAEGSTIWEHREGGV